MNKILKYFLLLCVAYLALSLIISPRVCINAGQKAIELCINTVIPSLFPFLICSGLLSALGASALCSRYLSPLMRPLFGIPGSGALAFILGIISGYPTGAICAADLYRHGECTKAEAERMTAFCNNSGPLFIIGVVGTGILGKTEIGMYLFISNIVSALLCGMIIRFLPIPRESGQLQLSPSAFNTKKDTVRSLGSVIDNSVFSMTKICAFIILFSVVGAVLPRFWATPFIHSFLEITGGINSVYPMKLDPVLKLSLISFFIAFSGISVLLQVASVISPCGLSVKPYFCGKLLQGAFSFAITYVLFTYFPITENVFSVEASPVIQSITPYQHLISSLICVSIGIICAIILCFISKSVVKPLINFISPDK